MSFEETNLFNTTSFTHMNWHVLNQHFNNYLMNTSGHTVSYFTSFRLFPGTGLGISGIWYDKFVYCNLLHT